MVRVEASISCLAQRVGPRGSATSIISRMSDPVNRVMSPGSCVLVNDEGVELKVTGLRAEVRVVGSVTAVEGGAWRVIGAGEGAAALSGVPDAGPRVRRGRVAVRVRAGMRGHGGGCVDVACDDDRDPRSRH